MRCPCCGGSLSRQSEMAQEPRGMRQGDCWCTPCEWIIARESALEDARPKTCPKHAAGSRA